MATVRRLSTLARSAVFTPIGDEGRAARVESRLAAAIHSGVLADGERLPSEPELASMLGVATVTAREALVALRSQGLVTTTRGRGGGSFVRRPHGAPGEESARLGGMSRVELHDRCTVYAVVLSGCAELAAERADPSDVEGLRLLLVPVGETDVDHWRHADSELYLSIAASTRSARLTREVIRLEADLGALLRVPLAHDDFRTTTARRHRALVDAVEAHDPGAARRCVQDHVGDARDRLAALHEAVRR
jgi:DNA-binding FadR family transcriptional regulator